MRVSRGDYDKPHRCPGWSGSGWTWNRQDWCDGSVTPRWLNDSSRPGWQWRIRKTNCCGTYVLPDALRWFEWRTYAYKIKRLWRNQ